MKKYTSKQFFLLVIVIFISISNQMTFSQTSELRKKIVGNRDFKRAYDVAEIFTEEKNFIEAIDIYLMLDSIWPDNPNLNFKIGYCYMHIRGKKTLSIPYLEKALTNVSIYYQSEYIEINAPIETYYYMAQAYHINYVFPKAIKYYNLYLNFVSDKELQDEVKFMIEKVYNAQKLIGNPISIKIENLGPVANSPYPDYSPVISNNKDFIIFTSRRDNSTGGKRDPHGLFFEDIYISRLVDGKWGKAEHIKGDINTPGHEAAISLSHNGDVLFIYRDDKGDGNIYMSEYNENKGEWLKPEKLPHPINTEHWETHATLSPDGKTLYFISDKPGGYGGRDIYKSLYLSDNKWDIPENLGLTINTKYDEEAPFILSDGFTLYFASQGHENMGGFDIFASSLSMDGFWETPENIGYPINTTEDDVFYYPTADEKNAVFTTSRQLRGIGDLDINYITIVSPKKRYIPVRGIVTDETTFKPVIADITIINKENNRVTSKLTTNESGEFRLTFPTGTSYIVEANSENYRKGGTEFSISKDETRPFISVSLFLSKLSKPDDFSSIIVEDIEVGEIFTLNNIFYDFDKATLRPESKDELNRLINFMNKMPLLVIEISGHTDNVGTDEYNQKLSQDRAQSVIDYLIKNAISKARLEAKGYGSSKPVASNETEEGRQLNRRTEFKILKK